MEKYSVYQCKRVKGFGPAKIKKAIAEFLKGEWVNKADMFVLCIQESLRPKDRADAFETQQALLKARGVTLLPWDSDELSIKLKDIPELVDDFFGREWVQVFCGQERAEKLGKRLDVKQITEFRRRCAAFYKHVFNTHDPGLPMAALGNVNSLPLEDRYVLPDVYDRRVVSLLPSPEATGPAVSENERQNGPSSNTAFGRSQRTIRGQRQSVTYRQRHAVEAWLTSTSRSLILGGPGSGKSTLLRFIAIDLLQESPHLSLLSQAWGQFLPVWVPFALWTKMIADSATTACSLSELLQRWLKSWDEERLWPLVEQALEDERLLLLVDGLDEWTSESAAGIALDRLKVFVEQRGVPALVTSRPRGFDRLGMQETGWQLGELSDFSVTQQRQLARLWFAHRIRSIDQGATYEEHEAEQKAEAETDEFFAELQRSADLRELAKIPLLLCLLIYHRFHHVRLPQSRFKAYDSLIEHLISVHPQRRRTAALLPDALSGLTDDDIKSILARLACHIQEHFGEGVIDHNVAISVVEDYLRDGDCGLGFEQREARQYSRQAVEVGEGTLGLLVRRSPKEIGFFHRVFQEYLAAYHLSRLPLAEQLSVIERHCVDPQWHETLLGLFHITSRAEDIKQFVSRVKTKLVGVNAIEHYAIDLLLCEVAFGEYNCSVGLARELAQETFEQIELGSWMPHRERLLQCVLDGLRSTKVKELVKVKLRSWFLCRVRWRENIFRAMASWPRSPEVVECLWKGIHDEEPNNQRAAARALADLTSGDLAVGNRVASLAYNAVDPKTRAAALEALLCGWPAHVDVERTIEMARGSMNPELRLVAILGRIQRHVQTEEDWEELLRLGSWAIGLEYQWRDDVALALMSGWPQSPKTKEACFEVLWEYSGGQHQLEKAVALRILLEGYPQDDDVAQFCVNQITHERSRYLFRYDTFRRLGQNFRDYSQIVEALDEWISKQKYIDPDVAMAALVGRTPKAKTKILSLLGSAFVYWPAWALIEGWGMQDPEVAEILTPMAFSPAAEASQIGALLPQIIKDRGTCRHRLLELLRDIECERPDLVMAGLAALGNTQGDTEVVDAVLNSVLNRLDRDSYNYDSIIERLIAGYSSDQRVKSLAEQELSECTGWYASVLYTAVAQAYGDDEAIQHRIIESACPLPTPLRKRIATYLGEGGIDEAFAMSLLKLYDHESDGEIKTQASIGYHMRLKVSGQDVKAAVDTLSQRIVCVGFDYRERREAAFCGLVILDRLDVMINARERGDNIPCAISVVKGIDLNVPLLRHVLQNWDDLKAALGTEFWSRLFQFNSDSLDLWDVLCMFVDDYPSPRDEALRFLEERTERTAKPNILRFLGRASPRSPLLLEYCVKALCIGEDLANWENQGNWSMPEAVIAAELLGMHFGSESDVLTRVMATNSPGYLHPGMILALCEGWPESEELERIFEVACNQGLPINYTAYMHLISRKSSSEVVFEALMKELSTSERPNQWHSYVVTRPALTRLQVDDILLAMLSEHLQGAPTPSEKATIPRLIGAARGVSPELRAWCLEEMNCQLRGTEPPQIGVDLLNGELRPVVHSLLDALSQLG
jgi:hypothetical protein